MSLSQGQTAFVQSLINFANNDNLNREALANMRSGLGKKPGEMARVHKYVVPFLPEHDFADDWYYLLATLFGQYPVHNPKNTLPDALGSLRSKSDSTETRFIALLNCHSEDLPDHLRHAVSLLKSNDRAFDWFHLFNSLLQWDHPENFIQKSWARDFYNPRHDSDHEQA